MIIERSIDYPAIRALLVDERAYMRMANDDAPKPSEFPQDLSGDLEYVIARDVKGLTAVFVLVFLQDRAAEIHFCFHPRVWGSTLAIAQEFLSWLWHETGIATAIGPIPGYNKLALKLANRAGFSEVKREPGRVRKNGKAYDMVITKIERPA